MSADKDVLDGWCVYVERTSGSGSNSSDTESIEIISEDEAGNYQIYSKNHYHPSNTIDCDSTSGNNETIQQVAEIKEYSENDPSQLIVEEGKEAQEKDEIDEAKKTFRFLIPANNCDNNGETHELKTLSFLEKSQSDVQEDKSDPSQENNLLHCQEGATEKVKDEKCNQIVTEKSLELREEQSEDIIKSVVSTVSNEVSAKETNSNSITSYETYKKMDNVDVQTSEIETNTLIQSENTNKADEPLPFRPNIPNLSSQSVTTQTNKESATWKLVLNRDSKKTRKDIPVSLAGPGTLSSMAEDAVRVTRRSEATSDSKPSNDKKSRKNHNMKNPPDSSISRDDLTKKTEKRDLSANASVTVTPDSKCFDPSVRKARKRQSGKKFNQLKKAGPYSSSSSGNEMEDALPIDTEVNQSVETLKNEDAMMDSSADSTLVRFDSNRPEKDISTVVLIAIIGSVVCLIYSGLRLPKSTPISSQREPSVEEDLAAMHERYAQLVADWETKVLENAELDFQIALREKSAELSRATRPNISLTRVAVPDCMAPHLVTHMFSYLRQYPPDITDLTSWAKSMFCVDLSLLLTPMRVASYSEVLKLLAFLASPSSELDLRAVFDHYLAQQRIHIHDIIRRDYPEIYRTNSFLKPDTNVRPCMYCVSMQRFSLLKNRYAPRQDNMAALLTLSDYYARNEPCLRAMLNIDGRSIDRLHEIALDVLLSRSLSTAITLDPSLLHDYYLELILSNEDNLRQLSRQLFKYNILALQKFNVTVNKQRKHHTRKNKKSADDFSLEEEKETFTRVRDRNDDFRKFNKNHAKQEKEKFTSLGKGDIELFYDSQLRAVSKGYSSSVIKFLADINKDLKHALCYPYANDVEMAAPISERSESLVRFIRNMCRTNVLNKNVGEPMEEAVVAEEAVNDGVVIDHGVKEALPEMSGDRLHSTKFEEKEVNNRKDIKENPNPLIELPYDLTFNAVESMNSFTSGENSTLLKAVEYNRFHIFEGKETFGNEMRPVNEDREMVGLQVDKTRESEDNKLLGYHNIISTRNEINLPMVNEAYAELTDGKMSEDKGLLDLWSHTDGRMPQGEVLDPRIQTDGRISQGEALLDPERHMYRQDNRKKSVLLDPDSHFGNTSQDEEADITEVEDTQFEDSLKRDLNNNTPDLWLMNKMADSFGFDANEGMKEPLVKFNFRRDGRRQRVGEFGQDFPGDKLNGQNDVDRIEEKAKPREERDRVNVYDTIRPRKSHRSSSVEKENVRPNARDGRRDGRVNAYDVRPQRLDREVFESGTIRPGRVERIIYIDGNESTYTRLVYIDNVERDGQLKKEERGGRQLKRKEEEMDWWLNRRARLRAKLRKKHTYPAQDPEYQYDYLYE